LRIPITMCHGTNRRRKPPLDAKRFEGYFHIASQLGFQSISYDDLADWRKGDATLPNRPIMFDFDHPAASIRHEILPIMQRFGFTGNLFIHTSPMTKEYPTGESMTWEEVRDLMNAGWHIGSHMHNHYNLAYLTKKDPSGALIRAQFAKCDGILNEHLGIISRDFAYTGTTWSRVAENEVTKRYRFGRLWIVGAHYETDQGSIRYADLVGVPGADEDDGGPPFAARYITQHSDPYRLPSMDFEYLIYEYDAFQRYLEGALETKCMPF
jgi:peptidoglycan/xylan/chitin deacetylase (PgdA/CDA1 family)